MPQEEQELKNTSGLCEVTENKQRYQTVVCLRNVIPIYVCILKCFYPSKHLEIEYYIAIFTSLRKKVCVESYIIWIIQQRQVLFIIRKKKKALHSESWQHSCWCRNGEGCPTQPQSNILHSFIRFLIWQQDWPLVQRLQIHSHILFIPAPRPQRLGEKMKPAWLQES